MCVQISRKVNVRFVVRICNPCIIINLTLYRREFFFHTVICWGITSSEETFLLVIIKSWKKSFLYTTWAVIWWACSNLRPHSVVCESVKNNRSIHLVSSCHKSNKEKHKKGTTFFFFFLSFLERKLPDVLEKKKKTI